MLHIAQENIRVADADGSRSDNGGNIEFLLQIFGRLAALIPVQSDGAYGIGCTLQILNRCAAMGFTAFVRQDRGVEGLDFE
ncbi:hypothetical protein D3C81_2215120 [compost metagenome]